MDSDKTFGDYLSSTTVETHERNNTPVKLHFITRQTRDIETADRPRGFDRLIEMGFERDEVRRMREMFHRDGVVDWETGIRREEAFLEEGGSMDRVADMRDGRGEVLRGYGDYRDIFEGLLVGFVGGVLLVVWMMDQDYGWRRGELVKRMWLYGFGGGVIGNFFLCLGMLY